MNSYEILVQRKITLTDESLGYIMSAALSGGINYWCNRVETKKPLVVAEYMSDALAETPIILYFEGEETKEMSATDLVAGIQKWVDWNGIPDYCNDEIEGMDANDADMCVQFAVFGKLIYG